MQPRGWRRESWRKEEFFEKEGDGSMEMEIERGGRKLEEDIYIRGKQGRGEKISKWSLPLLSLFVPS